MLERHQCKEDARMQLPRPAFWATYGRLMGIFGARSTVRSEPKPDCKMKLTSQMKDVLEHILN